MSVTDEIRSKLDIVDTVSRYVPLRQSGRAFKANCPFHTERTPSFIVNPERQSWRCFGACATGGDVFSFVMKAENLEFGDALRSLARRAGVQLGSPKDRKETNRAHSVNRAAAEFYQRALASDAGAVGRKYLDERGVGAQARERFQLGLSPNQWGALCEYLRTHDFSADDILAAGLARRSERGQLYDFFRGRLMFPIWDRDGNVAGFGARALDDSNPKYINTAATEAFDKRNTLYALHMAIPTIRQSGTAVIVEGYMDAIAAHENGYMNVVASMGTALTESQVSQLRALARDYVLALDPDAAGQEATLRSLESSWRVFRGVAARRSAASQSVLSQWKPPMLKVAELPSGLDPDALIRENPKLWESTIDAALPLLDFVIPALVSRTDLSVPDSRANIAREVGRLIQKIDDMDQFAYWNKLAEALGVPLDTLRASMGTGGGGRRGRRGGERRAESEDVEVSANMLADRRASAHEELALTLLIRYPSLIEEARDTDPSVFTQTELRQLFTELRERHMIAEPESELGASAAELYERLERAGSSQWAETGLEKARKALSQCISRLELDQQKELQNTLLMTDDPSAPPPRELQEKIDRANRRIRELEHSMRTGVMADSLSRSPAHIPTG